MQGFKKNYEFNNNRKKMNVIMSKISMMRKRKMIQVVMMKTNMNNLLKKFQW